MSSAGRKLLSAIVANSDLDMLIQGGILDSMFKDGEIILWNFISEHVSSFGVVPSQETVEDKLGDMLVDAPEPPAYYLVELERRYMQQALKKALLESEVHLNAQEPEKAFAILLQQVSDLNIHKKRKSLIDFRDVADMIANEYKKQKKDEEGYALMMGWPSLDAMTGGLKAGDMCSIVGRPATGKAQPLTAKVLTPSGWSTMGEMVIGTQVASIDGKESVVEGVFPQGLKPVFRVHFQDGRSTEAADEHLWEVWYRDWDTPKVMTTLQVIEKLQHKRYQKRLSVRMFSGDFGAPLKFKFSPYLIAAFIGDGCFTGGAPLFSSEDPELVLRLDTELQEHRLSLIPTDRCNYRVSGSEGNTNPLKECLQDLGLWGHKAEHKFIPKWVLRGNKEVRQEFLRGLMDTDGTAGKVGDVSFCSTSMKLAYQVQELVWSLGGRATVAIKKTESLPAYIVSIVMKDRESLFWLDRKKERVRSPRTTHTNTRLRIDSVEYLGEQECQCIQVSHPEHLYVTDNYIVTHNTFMGLYVSNHAWRVGGTPLVISMEMTNLAISQRLAAMSASKPLSHLLKGELSDKGWLQFMTALGGNAEAETPYWLVDGNLATSVDDIVMLGRQLQPSSIFIDGAYLLRHPNQKLSKWDKLNENAEGIKQRLATDLKLPVVCSYQFSRDVSKKKKKDADEKPGLEDIYGTDAIGQLSSLVMGLFEAESIETARRRRVSILKGRNGETGEFLINWDFHGMDFSEVPTVKGPNGKLMESTTEMGWLG